MKSEWQQAPDSELPRLDIRWLLQEIDEERIPTQDDVDTSTTVPVDEVNLSTWFIKFFIEQVLNAFLSNLGFAWKSKRNPRSKQMGNDGANRRKAR